jgi:hypothetical protein
MPRDTHHVNVGFINIDRYFSHGLRRVGVKVYATMLSHNCTNFLHWLDDTGLVVDRHYRNKGGVRANGGLESFEVNYAIRLHRKIGYFKVFFAEFPARIQDALMLLQGPSALIMKPSGLTHRLCRDNVSFLVFIEPCDTLNGHVIGLGSTRSEDDVLGFCSNKVRHVLEDVTRSFLRS